MVRQYSHRPSYRFPIVVSSIRHNSQVVTLPKPPRNGECVKTDIRRCGSGRAVLVLLVVLVVTMVKIGISSNYNNTGSCKETFPDRYSIWFRFVGTSMTFCPPTIVHSRLYRIESRLSNLGQWQCFGVGILVGPESERLDCCKHIVPIEIRYPCN